MLAAVPAQAESLEQAVLAEINRARADPAAYAVQLRSYRHHFRGQQVREPGQPITYRTVEGARPVDEAIAFLDRQPNRPTIRPATLLARGAADHARDQGAAGAMGHHGSDGSDPPARIRRHGGGAQVAEIIAYGGRTAREMVRILIVDDGVPDRGHRGAVFAPELRFAGVACGPHRRYRQLCVIDLASTHDATAPVKMAAR